ncbi:NACHT, LRR and PYD domains-containing protein 12-like [Sparus aurata]|uniref:NACHT, LRR and PYD domains-containing protein 12-like n=1 Tax=Sparus aurata TaxID=8175 RepID=UPI0011C1C5B3|nr:NACHT, LRR and PYD domains-containing protein 12-like [Sparus aurata]
MRPSRVVKLRSTKNTLSLLTPSVLCQGSLKDPVSTSCGHWFCRRCITSHWDQSASSEDFFCPKCRKRPRTRPGLQAASQTSTVLRDFGLQKVLHKYKVSLRRRCERVTEGTDEAGSGTLLNRIYIELYITEGQSEEVNTQHEVRQLETASMKRTINETPIRCSNIFKAKPGQQRNIRVVLTNGVAGVGKTFSVQKFTLDWAENLENQDVSLLILLSFRELNLIKDEQYSLLRLLHVFHPTLQKVTAEQLAVCKLLFIFDGLDESRLSLDFNNNEVVSDVTQKSSVSVLLTNLIKGNLLPSALVWITSQPAAANQIPPECVDRVTEVQGFTEAQKEEYFRRRFGYQDLSSRIISAIKTSRTLNIMCLIPVFCWITATVLEHMLTTDDTGELPKTLTNLYSHFLLVSTKRKMGMGQQEQMVADIKVFLKLGRLAFEHMKNPSNRKLMFYPEDLEKCGLDVGQFNSQVYTKIFKREFGIFQKTVYSFVHLSIQEFLAAVYMFHCYSNSVDVKDFLGKMWEYENTDPSLDVFLRSAMEKSLESENGHLDLFVRFLHGLSLESNQRLFRGLLGRTDNSPKIIQRAIKNLKKMKMDEISPDRSINIFHCLMEMNDHSVHKEIQEFLKSENRSKKKLSEIHCSALAYMLQMSEEVLYELDLNKYRTSVKGKQRLIPAVRNCRRARLAGCELSTRHCNTVALALKSFPSHLRELELSNNYLGYPEMEQLVDGLKSPHCRLLQQCELSVLCCSSLASALKSNPIHLRVLELSNNKLQDPGVLLLCSFLRSPLCRLETLGLQRCELSVLSCRFLASALKSDYSHLRELNLRENQLPESGVKLLSDLMESPHGRLKTLRVDDRRNRVTLFSHKGYPSTSEDMAEESKEDRPCPDDPQRLNQQHLLLCGDKLNTNDKQVFTPELLTESQKRSYRFWCSGPGVFQCKSTGLVFVMVQEAELLYRTVQWDESLLRSAGKMAAGLLFDIKCSNDSAVCQLHLPHCEVMDAPLPEGLLSVVHITDDGMNFLEPLEITDTHVVVTVSHFSPIGIVKDFIKRLLNKMRPVSGRVLLFLRQPNPETQRQKLDVFLLPKNIHRDEVSAQQRYSENIQVPSKCKLIEDQSYTLHCPQAIKIQPKSADFDLEFGPDYYPTFEVRLETTTEELTLIVKDRGQLVVWEHDVDLTDSTRRTGQMNVPAEDDVPAERKLSSIRTEFVKRVSEPVLNQLLDKLLDLDFINDEEMQSVQTEPSTQAKARKLINTVRKKGTEASSVLITALCDLDRHLSGELKLR